MKKGYLLIATMICLGAIILVGYQNCGLSGSKKSHTKVTPVNPDAKPTMGVLDSSQLNATQVQAAGGMCDLATNVLRFSPQEPAFKVNCAQLEELKTLIAPNILTVEYFKSGSILMDTAGNIIQVSIVNPPATPKMVGSVPSQVTALQVVNAGLNTVNITGGAQNLVVADFSNNYLREEPLLPNNPDVILDENPVCDGATSAESCVKSGAALPKSGNVDLEWCYTLYGSGPFSHGANFVMRCSFVMSHDGVGANKDLKVILNGGNISSALCIQNANDSTTERFTSYLDPAASVSLEVIKVNEQCKNVSQGTVVSERTFTTNVAPAFNLITDNSTVNDKTVTINLTYDFPAQASGDEIFQGALVHIFCAPYQYETIPLPSTPSVTLAANSSTCMVDSGSFSCSVDYQFTITGIGANYVGIYLNNVLQICMPNSTVNSDQLANGVTRSATLAYQNSNVTNHHTISAKLFSDSNCNSNSGVAIGNTIEFDRIGCGSNLSYNPTEGCVAGANQGGDSGNTPSFRFFNAPSDTCTVPGGKSFCSDDYRVKSSGSVSGLPAGKRILVQANGSGKFACLQNGDTLNNLPGPGSAGEGTWIGIGYSVTFKAFVVDIAGDGCAFPESNAIAIDTLLVDAIRE